MKTTYEAPLIPPHETSDETLTRLSANIGTLTGLMNDAGRDGHFYLAATFNRVRDAKVAQAKTIIALVNLGSEAPADDRRFLLVHGATSTGGVSILPRHRFAQSPVQLALTV